MVSLESNHDSIMEYIGNDFLRRDSLGIIVGAAIGFHCTNCSLQHLSDVPQKMLKQQHAWRNTVISFLHALLVGPLSMFCLYTSPDVMDDLINNYTPVAESLVALSTGYFVYDFVDLCLNKRMNQIWPLILHHTIVIFAFGISLTTNNYIGYAVVSLLAEVNSIFLHIRQIFLMYNINTFKILYVVNSFLSIITFLIFRFFLFYWMAMWICRNFVHIPKLMSIIGLSSLFTLSIINIFLFSRLIHSDFIKKRNSCNNNDLFEK